MTTKYWILYKENNIIINGEDTAPTGLDAIKNWYREGLGLNTKGTLVTYTGVDNDCNPIGLENYKILQLNPFDVEIVNDVL